MMKMKFRNVIQRKREVKIDKRERGTQGQMEREMDRERET
jgi:hypothetical protein